MTRRRLGGAVFILAGLAVAAVVLWPSPVRRQAPPPVRIVAVPPLGLAFAHPRDWVRSVDRRVIRLRSPDGAAIVLFSSPYAGRRPRRLKREAERALLRRFEPATVVRDGPGRLGVRTVSSFELDGYSREREVRALVMIDSTPYRTYAVTVLTPGQPSRRRLREVEAILRTVRLSKPVRLTR